MRISQDGLKKCKTGLKKCEVSSDILSCTHCRYNKCIKIGMTPQQTKNNDETFLGPGQRRSVIQEVPGHSADIVGGSNNRAKASFNKETFLRPGLRRSVIQYVPGHSANTIVDLMTTKTKGTNKEVGIPGLNGGSNDRAEFCFQYIRPADQISLGVNMDNVEDVTLARESGVVMELRDKWCMDMNNYDFDISYDLPDIN